MLLWCGSSPDWDLVLCPPTVLCRATNNDRYDVHNISMHIHKCTDSAAAWGRWSPPHLVLLLEPRLYLNTKESPTRYDWSRSPSLWIRFFFFFYFYTNTFQQIYTWRGEVRDCERSKISSSPPKYCLLWSRNGNVWNQSLSVATMITNIHIMSNKLTSMYNVKQKAACRQDNGAFLQNYLL